MGDGQVPVPARHLLGDAGELAGRADAAGVAHAGVGLVRLDVATPSRATAIVAVAVAVGGGWVGVVRVGGSTAAGR